MKKLLFLFGLLILLSCSKNKKSDFNKAKIKEIQNTEITKINENVKVDSIFIEFKQLYIELLQFKDSADFKSYGFGKGGKYNDWLKKVEKLKNNPDSKLLLKKDIVVGELEQLGLEYVSSKGEETETSKFLNSMFLNKIYTNSGKKNYEDIRNDFDRLGKWYIQNTIVKEGYPFEIYQKGNIFIGVKLNGNYNTDILNKVNDKFYVRNSDTGVYYKISTNKEMTFFDREGDLSKVGYIISLIE